MNRFDIMLKKPVPGPDLQEEAERNKIKKLKSKGSNERKRIKRLLHKVTILAHSYDNIPSVLGYTWKRGRGKYGDYIVPYEIDKSITHVKCKPKEFLDLLAKIKLSDLKSCCDPLNRIFGFVYEKKWFFIPWTLMKEYEGKTWVLLPARYRTR